MTTTHEVSDWSGERGRKWLAQASQMEAMLAPIDEPLIDALELAGPVHAIDIGCGAGGSSLRLQQRADPASQLLAVDISADLIAAARQRVVSQLPPLQFSCADVSQMAPPQQAFDCMLSRFGSMFFSRPSETFRQLHGWLRPAGRFAFAVWDAPQRNPWMSVVRSVVAQWIEPPPLAEDAAGPFRYAEVHKLLALLQQAGFVELQHRSWQHPLMLGGGLRPQQAAQFALRAFSVAEPLLQAGGRPLAEAEQQLSEIYAQYQHQGLVRMPASVHLVSGRA